MAGRENPEEARKRILAALDTSENMQLPYMQLSRADVETVLREAGSLNAALRTIGAMVTYIATGERAPLPKASSTLFAGTLPNLNRRRSNALTKARQKAERKTLGTSPETGEIPTENEREPSKNHQVFSENRSVFDGNLKKPDENRLENHPVSQPVFTSGNHLSPAETTPARPDLGSDVGSDVRPAVLNPSLTLPLSLIEKESVKENVNVNATRARGNGGTGVRNGFRHDGPIIEAVPVAENPPTPEEVMEYGTSKGLRCFTESDDPLGEAGSFIDYNAATGWMVGESENPTPVTDWRGLLTLWDSRAAEMGLG